MAVQQAPSGAVPPSVDVVSKAFVYQYYLILHQSPEHVHQFYHDSSKLGRPEANGFMGVTSTMKAINEKILSLDYGEFRAEIITVDAQDSYNGGVLVLVTGFLTGRDNARRKFTQTFFLAPQENGYFVLNDMFRYELSKKKKKKKRKNMVRYVEEPQLSDANPVFVDDAKAPLAVEQDNTQDQENDIPEQIPVSSEEVEQEEVGQEEVYNPTENGDVSVVDEIPVPEVVDEIPVDPEREAESDAKYEDVPKKSYAYIVKVMKDGPVQVPLSTPAPVKSSPKAQELQLTASLLTAPTVENLHSNSKANEIGNGQESESDGHSIYLKGLPMSVAYPQVESEFSKFGPIKSGGIQIRSQKGFCFGFVEFEERSSAVTAIEASPINIGGRQVAIEPKNSTIRGKLLALLLEGGVLQGRLPRMAVQVGDQEHPVPDWGVRGVGHDPLAGGSGCSWACEGYEADREGDRVRARQMAKGAHGEEEAERRRDREKGGRRRKRRSWRRR